MVKNKRPKPPKRPDSVSYFLQQPSEITSNQEWTLENAKEYLGTEKQQKFKVQVDVKLTEDDDREMLRKIQAMKEWANFKTKINKNVKKRKSNNVL